jgi:hypothetical protein
MTYQSRFEQPRMRGVSSPRPADWYTFLIEPSTRVTVVYMGNEVLLEITVVLNPNELFWAGY